ncbi:MAG: hypothetical protein IKU29_03990 [Parabacteroides sp.]|nr:hypothetical protein [Parabacteroides sp.]
MLMQYTPDFKGDKISSTELVAMGFRIKKFVENYRKYILIKTPNKYGKDPFEILDTLDLISHKLITKQFDELFDDIRVVDYTSDSDVPF